MKKRRASITLMVFTITAIVAFQLFWLYKNYSEEKRIFTIRTGLLFRESIFKLQASKLHLDTNYNVRIEDKSGIISMTNELRAQLIDTTHFRHRETRAAVIVAMKHPDGKEADSTKQVMYRYSNDKVFDFLEGVDSLQDLITVKDVTSHYERELAKEGITIPFTVTSHKDSSRSEFLPPELENNKVTVGFTHPVTYQLSFFNSSWYLLKKISAQILFSLLLISVTIFSFLLLFRYWQQQRRLTELKNDFISNITHELKTPLATVSVAIEALKNFNALGDPQRTKEYLDISGNELQRLSMLVDKVLRLSMFEKHQIELRNESFNMKTLLDEVMGSMKLQFEKYEAQVSLQTEGNNFLIKADKMHITSVIFNLLDNALKYSKANPSIQVELKDQGEELFLSVTDNGTGIAEEYQQKIFEKFFRVPTGNKHNVKGYGLGLSYSAYVLQRQSGTVSVQSTEGIGSRFTIKLPKANG